MVDNFNVDCKIEEIFLLRRGDVFVGRGSLCFVFGVGFEFIILFVVFCKVFVFEEKKVIEVLGFGIDVFL